MTEKLKEQFKLTRKYLRNALDVAVPFLCLGVVVQLIVGESLFGWNPIKNIQSAINSMGQSNFIGIATLLVLYSVFLSSNKNTKHIVKPCLNKAFCF